MSITRKQRLAMAAIVAAGLLGAGGVLLTDRHAGAEAQEHEHEHEHEEAHGKEAAGAASLVKVDEAQSGAAGIAVAPAGPATLQSGRDFQGEIRFDEDRTAHVVPRLAGVAERVTARLGERVARGQVLAVIASPDVSERRSEILLAQRRVEAARASFERERKLWQDRISAEQDYLQAQTALREADIALANAREKLHAVGVTRTASALNRFDVSSPFAGTVVEKHLTLGEAVKEDSSIFTISNLDAVWAEFAVGPRDLEAVRVGQKVVVSSTSSQREVQGTVSYVGALLGEQTRTARARVALANPQGAWRPGLFVTVRVLGDDERVAVAVPAEAVQTIDGQATVFKSVPGGFRATPVRTGRSDGRNVEIAGGLQAGEPVATRNAFVLKAEQGKGSASHAH
jgi:cobalt-zinc-cadmium efflux system membrane fusion protein